MLRALTRSGGTVAVRQVDLPKCTSNDSVRVRVIVAGMCRTDIYIAQGRIAVREPLVLGHEFTGIVEEVGRNASLQPGQHVTANPLLSCGRCGPCQSGSQCSRPLFLGVDVDGAFADNVVLPAKNVWPIPKDLEPRRAAYTEPVAAALAVLNAPITSDMSGIIFGNNRIASLTERILRLRGFRHVQKIDLLGAGAPSSSADFAVETEATEHSLLGVVESLKPNGLGILKSRPAFPVPLNIALAVKKDLTFKAVSYGSFDAAVELVSGEELFLDDLLGPIFPLEEYERAIEASEGCGAVKSFFDLRQS